ncbi:DUF1570 domain-containing protein [Polystyrenella longa]|nr:DUF1570 domain-containing protein [Polystyrenella longa]
MLMAFGWCVPRAQADSLVEMTVGKSKESYQGRVEGQNQKFCWLMGQDGILHQVPLKEVTNFRRVSPQFKCLSTLQMKSNLYREFGRDYEIATSAHYVTVAPPGRASTYAKMFDLVYRQFFNYFKIRGMNLEQPEFTMVSIVFPDEKSFVEYCKRDGVRYSQGLRGYYQPRTNRVALFIPDDRLSFKTSANSRPAPDLSQQLLGTGSDFPTTTSFQQPNYYANLVAVDDELRNTIIHEGTHQVAFNMNLHSRLGDNPRWIVEGLATVFESPGVRNSSRVTSDKLNSERFLWFKDYAESRRPDQSLPQFIVSDDLFQSSSLDAYSEAWALSFYLLETRPRQYVDYLKRVSTRSNGRLYTPDERLTDFQEVIHHSLPKVEMDYLRFHAKLKR